MKANLEIGKLTLGQLIEASKTEEGRAMLARELEELEQTAKRVRKALRQAGHEWFPRQPT